MVDCTLRSLDAILGAVAIDKGVQRDCGTSLPLASFRQKRGPYLPREDIEQVLHTGADDSDEYYFEQYEAQMLKYLEADGSDMGGDDSGADGVAHGDAAPSKAERDLALHLRLGL